MNSIYHQNKYRQQKYILQFTYYAVFGLDLYFIDGIKFIRQFYYSSKLNIIRSNQILRTRPMTANFTRKKIQSYSYGLDDAIGKGYSSQVYKGKNDETNESVAVKVIDLKMLKNQINKTLLESQIHILKQLKSLPHILNLYEVFTTKNNTYIVTELCQSDLNKLVKKGLSEQQACTFMQQIVTGYLNFARKQIIHRDLKPANILVTQNQQLKIADFGFAIKAADAHKYSKYNVGSPLYMAPQSLKRNEYTLKTDIWALGIIFYQLLTGSTPWKAKNEKELISKIETQKAQTIISKLNVNPIAIDFLRKTLRIDKNTRMSMEDLCSFSFINSLTRPNILTEKKTNIVLKIGTNQRSLSSFSPKIEKSLENKLFLNINHQNQNRLSSKDLSEGKMNTVRYDSANKSLQLKPKQIHKCNPSVTLEFYKKEQSVSKQNPQFLVPQPRLQPVESAKKNDKKITSKILISEIHFCRFLYKLLARINECLKSGLLKNIQMQVEKVNYDYIGIIKHKIQNLLTFKSNNYINASNYEEYKETNDFNKLMKIAKQYKDRYINQMKPYWNTSKCVFSTNNTLALVASLQKLLQLREKDEEFTTLYERQIIILDYLMTAKQLIDIFQNGQNYERFARKSRIQQIVQGRTAEISWDLYTKIIQRSKQITQAKKLMNLPNEPRGMLVTA